MTGEIKALLVERSRYERGRCSCGMGQRKENREKT